MEHLKDNAKSLILLLMKQALVVDALQNPDDISLEWTEANTRMYAGLTG